MNSFYHTLSYIPVQEVFSNNDKHINAIRYRFIMLLDGYINIHNKAFIAFFNITFPQEYKMDATYPYASRFSQKLRQYFQRNGYAPVYLKAREQNISIHPHYHYAIMLDGNKIQHPYLVTTKAQQLWASTLGLDSAEGLVHYETSVMLRRYAEYFPEALKIVLDKMDYLAKKEGKGPKNDGIRNFGCSRIPKTIVNANMNM